jgi:hypothetical protein
MLEMLMFEVVVSMIRILMKMMIVAVVGGGDEAEDFDVSSSENEFAVDGCCSG